MDDKQTKDGSFIANIVNNGLISAMRALGFAIPGETVAVLKNDSEIMETNNSIIAQAVQMNQAGLIMDAAYFTGQTGIPVSEPPAPVMPKGVAPSIQNKLEKIYNKTSCNVHAH